MCTENVKPKFLVRMPCHDYSILVLFKINDLLLQGRMREQFFHFSRANISTLRFRLGHLIGPGNDIEYCALVAVCKFARFCDCLVLSPSSHRVVRIHLHAPFPPRLDQHKLCRIRYWHQEDTAPPLSRLLYRRPVIHSLHLPR